MEIFLVASEFPGLGQLLDSCRAKVIAILKLKFWDYLLTSNDNDWNEGGRECRVGCLFYVQGFFSTPKDGDMASHPKVL